jgi:Flp pilus assembly protein TadG
MSTGRNREKGQAMVEFAIVVPLFFFMLYAFSYLGMFFHDYLTLNEMTRNIARQASVGISLDKIKKNYSNKTFLTSVYTFTFNPEKDVMVEDSEDVSEGQKVIVTLTASRNMEGKFWKEVFPDTITSSLTMRKEE